MWDRWAVCHNLLLMSVVILAADSVGRVSAILLVLQFVTICAFVLGRCESGCPYQYNHLPEQTRLRNDRSCVPCASLTDGGQVPSEFGVGRMLMQIVALRFCHKDTKRSVLWPLKYTKIRLRPGLCSGPCWGSLWRSPRPRSRLGTEHPSPYLTPIGTDLSLALAVRPPEFQPDLRLCPCDVNLHWFTLFFTQSTDVLLQI